MLSSTSLAYMALELIIAALAVAGNVLVCWAVSANSNLQSVTNFFVVSLAAADIAVGLLAIPFAVVISTGFCGLFHGCLFIVCFVLVLTQSSIFSLLAIAVDRYIAIKSPLRYNSLVTGGRAKAIIGVCWVLSVVIGLTPMLGWNRCPDSTNSTCPAGMTECLFEKVVTMQYMVYFNFFGCVLAPLLAMLAIYTRIFMAARHQLRQMELKLFPVQRGRGKGALPRSTLQREVHAAKSLAIIVGLFAVCWLPLHIINCFTLFCPRCARPPVWVMYLAIILSHANSVVNPFIYAYRLREFRRTFRRILRLHLLGGRGGRGRGRGSSFGTSTRVSVVDTFGATTVNGCALEPSPMHGSGPPSTVSQWRPMPDPPPVGYVSSNGRHPAAHAPSPQPRRQRCTVGSAGQSGNEMPSARGTTEVVEVKDCGAVSSAHGASLFSTRTSRSFELTEVS